MGHTAAPHSQQLFGRPLFCSCAKPCCAPLPRPPLAPPLCVLLLGCPHPRPRPLVARPRPLGRAGVRGGPGPSDGPHHWCAQGRMGGGAPLALARLGARPGREPQGGRPRAELGGQRGGRTWPALLPLSKASPPTLTLVPMKAKSAPPSCAAAGEGKGGPRAELRVGDPVVRPQQREERVASRAGTAAAGRHLPRAPLAPSPDCELPSVRSPGELCRSSRRVSYSGPALPTRAPLDHMRVRAVYGGGMLLHAHGGSLTRRGPPRPAHRVLALPLPPGMASPPPRTHLFCGVVAEHGPVLDAHRAVAVNEQRAALRRPEQERREEGSV